MPLGPVFNAELLTTARRPRYYMIRFLYGLIILAQLYLTYQEQVGWFGNSRGPLQIRGLAALGQIFFAGFAIVQAAVVVFLTPALVGGAIADERQRKTLHYLLTSQLSSFEIVVGKLAARLLQVGVLVALGLPVVSLIGLFGGIDFQVLLFTYAATFTTVYFLATASILVSVVSRRPREAISLLYILEIIWLIVPTMLIRSMPTWVEPWPTIASWVNPVLEYAALTSPIFVMSRMGFGTLSGQIPMALWGMGLQILYGTAFMILATIRLRPSYRNDGGTPKWVRGFAKLGRKRSWFSRPECGDDAMLWKEMYVSRTGGLTKAVLVILGVSMIGIMGYSAYGFVVDAVREMWRDGYFGKGSARDDFNSFLTGVSSAIFVLWSLGIASSSASGLSSEREEDQWTSLTTTPLTGSEIIRAKMIGPVFGLRLVAYLMFLMWGIGLAVGSVHPFGLLACLVEFVVFTTFLTALGNFFSLRSKNSTRSLALTMAVLVFLNGGYLFCCLPFRLNTFAIAAGSTPYVFAISLLSVKGFSELPNSLRAVELIAACVMSVVLYGFSAVALTTSMVASFDAILDRPDRLLMNRTANQRREMVKRAISNEISDPDGLL